MNRLTRKQHDNILMELRRGGIVLAILGALSEAQYGYSLKQRLAENGLEVSEGTLYPLMRRLESQGLLESEWKVSANRPRRYYRISAAGRLALKTLMREWRLLVRATERMLR